MGLAVAISTHLERWSVIHLTFTEAGEHNSVAKTHISDVVNVQIKYREYFY